MGGKIRRTQRVNQSNRSIDLNQLISAKRGNSSSAFCDEGKNSTFVRAEKQGSNRTAKGMKLRKSNCGGKSVGRDDKRTKLRAAVEWADRTDKGKVSYMLLSDIFLVESRRVCKRTENGVIKLTCDPKNPQPSLDQTTIIFEENPVAS